MSDIEKNNEELESQSAEESACEESRNEEKNETESRSRDNEASDAAWAQSGGNGEIDYAALAKEDMRELIAAFPHLEGKKSIAELDNPLRYAALRDLGLTPREAFLATSAPVIKYDNRSHLSGAVPRRAGSASDMLGAGELMAARELFADLSDREIQKLYKKVSR